METDLTQEQQPSYATRVVPEDERNLILLVLDESIKAGKNTEFHYRGLNSLEHEALQRMSFIDKAFNAKKELFLKVDDHSYTYSRILSTAKLALMKLQDEGQYNYYSADLLCKFLQLEEIFGDKRLKPVGVRWIEEQERQLKERAVPVYEPPVQKELNGDEHHLPEGVSSSNIKRYKKKLQEQKEVSEVLNGLSFSEETMDEDEDKDTPPVSFEESEIDLESEQNADLSNMNFTSEDNE